VRRYLRRVTGRVFEVGDDSLAFLDNKLSRVEQIVRGGEERLQWLSKTVERLPIEEFAANSEVAAMLKTLDENVVNALSTAQQWLDSIHAIASGLGKVAESVVSSKYAAAHPDSLGVSIAERLQTLSASLVEILAMLQEIRQELLNFRSQAISLRDFAVMMADRLANVTVRVTNLAQQIEELHDKTAQMQGGVARWRGRLHTWTLLAAVLLTAFFAWFAASQISMVLLGWKWLLQGWAP
jgi:chromosome segregation ATPase